MLTRILLTHKTAKQIALNKYAINIPPKARLSASVMCKAPKGKRRHAVVNNGVASNIQSVIKRERRSNMPYDPGSCPIPRRKPAIVAIKQSIGIIISAMPKSIDCRSLRCVVCVMKQLIASYTSL